MVEVIITHYLAVGVTIAEIDAMAETKVYKLRDTKQVETFTTLLGIEGIKYHIFKYEEYTAIEITAESVEITRASAIYQSVCNNY